MWHSTESRWNVFDVIDEDGNKTGQVKERGVAHRDGTLHATVHIWIVRPNQESGYDVLFRNEVNVKIRTRERMTFLPQGMSVPGDELMESALREMKEELGIHAREDQLQFIGTHRGQFEAEFHGKPFRDKNAVPYIFIENRWTLKKFEITGI